MSQQGKLNKLWFHGLRALWVSRRMAALRWRTPFDQQKYLPQPRQADAQLVLGKPLVAVAVQEPKHLCPVNLLLAFTTSTIAVARARPPPPPEPRRARRQRLALAHEVEQARRGARRGPLVTRFRRRCRHGLGVPCLVLRRAPRRARRVVHVLAGRCKTALRQRQAATAAAAEKRRLLLLVLLLLVLALVVVVVQARRRLRWSPVAQMRVAWVAARGRW